MCNNNCCTCCQCGTHDDDTPQEITYTSVCNSDVCKDKDGCRCCCCKNKGVCENDPDIRLDGMEERMEECCEEVNERITNLECKLCEEISRSKSEDLKHDNNDKLHDDAIEDLYNRESIDVNNVVYVNTPGSEVIEFWHVFPEEDEKDPIKIGEVDAKPFLKDGILDSVELESNGHVLHFVWNTDAGKQDSHVDLDRLIQPIALELSEYKTYVSNTYETQVAAGNHIKDVDYDQNDHHTLVFTKENGQTITKTIPDSDLYIQSGQYTGGNLVLTRNNDTTVTIPVPATNHIVGGDIDGRVITLVRENNGAPVTIQLPADANTYPVSGVVNGNTLTITNSDNSTVPITLPGWVTTDNDHYPDTATIDGNRVLHLTGTNFDEVTVTLPADLDHYVTSGTVTNGVLKLTREGINGTVDITLPEGADGDHYPDTMTFDSNTRKLTLSGTNSTFSTLEATIPLPPADSTNPIVDVQQNGDTVTFTYKDNTSEPITVGGNTNVTYGGNTVTLLQAITSIENRLSALEGLWEINPNDSTQVVAKNNRSAKAAGFYDSTVNAV